VTYCTGKYFSRTIPLLMDCHRGDQHTCLPPLTYIYLTFPQASAKFLHATFWGKLNFFCIFIRSITSTLELIVHSNSISSIFTTNSDNVKFTFASFTHYKHAGPSFFSSPHVAVRPGPLPIRTTARPPYFPYIAPCPHYI